MDAESRNGVRVNGEPYAAIGLRHGDVIELGHLRFAFVEAGKPFKLPPEFARVASGAEPMEPRHHTALWVIAGVALVAALSGGTFLLLRHRLGGSEAVEAAPDAKAERKFALRAEARAEETFREMESAATSQDWERARKLLESLSAPRTHYGARAAEKADAIVAGYVNLHVAAAALMKGKDNAGCLAEAQLALAANPRSGDAKSLVEACRRPPVQTASVGSPRTATTTRAPRGGDDDARKLLNEGNQKLMAQDSDGAIALYEKALALKPGNAVLPGLYRSLGIAYTRQGNVEQGARYYKLYLPLCTNPAEKAQLEKVLAEYDARR
jgi:tetratricopeptide (TPR) repeat protein